MLNRVKLALRLTTDAFDVELTDLVFAAMADLAIAGVVGAESDPLIARAVITYCRANFSSPDDYDRLKASYDEQKAQLQMATGYGFPEEVAAHDV